MPARALKPEPKPALNRRRSTRAEWQKPKLRPLPELRLGGLARERTEQSRAEARTRFAEEPIELWPERLLRRPIANLRRLASQERVRVESASLWSEPGQAERLRVAVAPEQADLLAARQPFAGQL